LKTVEFEFDGQVHHLLLNAAALFDCYDHFGDKGDLLDRITGTSREAFDNTCWMLVKLAQQGEAYRRYMGEEKAPMLTVDRVQRVMGPMDMLRARSAICDAYHLGFERKSLTEEEKVDIGLLELQKKTGLASIVRNGFSGLLRSLASAHEKE